MLWLIPVINDTASVSPDSRRGPSRARRSTPGQLDVRSETSYSLAPEVFTRSGAVAVAAILLFPFAALAARRRWAAYVAGGSLAVLAVMLVPLLFTSLADLVSISQARRAAGFLPFAFAFAGGLGVLSRLLGVFVLPLASSRAWSSRSRTRGTSTTPSTRARRRGWCGSRLSAALRVSWSGSFGAGRRLEAAAGFAAALFLLPVVVVGLARWTPVEGNQAAALSPGLVAALRDEVPAGAIVYSDAETSFRLAAAAPVYIAVAPPGHVADTAENRPYERARDARRFVATGDLSIPERYGAEYLVVDLRRRREPFELPVLYRDPRFVLYRLPQPPRSSRATPSRLRPASRPERRHPPRDPPSRMRAAPRRSGGFGLVARRRRREHPSAGASGAA